MKIAATGLMGSGKSEILQRWADLMEEHTGVRPVAVDIARPIKLAAAEFFGVDVQYIEQNKQQYRVWLQETGRLWRFQYGEDCLIRIAARNAAEHEHAYVENVRMPWEFKAFGNAGWLLLGVMCDDDLRLARLTGKYGRPPTDAELNHETEVHIPAMLGGLHGPLMGVENNTIEQAQDIATLLTQLAMVEAGE